MARRYGGVLSGQLQLFKGKRREEVREALYVQLH
jgi:hypothetical protein